MAVKKACVVTEWTAGSVHSDAVAAAEPSGYDPRRRTRTHPSTQGPAPSDSVITRLFSSAAGCSSE